jgi:hypothetical protein
LPGIVTGLCRAVDDTRTTGENEEYAHRYDDETVHASLRVGDHKSVGCSNLRRYGVLPVEVAPRIMLVGPNGVV